MLVGANEQKIDIRDDAEAGFLIELAFKLIAEICFAVVQEFRVLPVRERILKINVFPNERVLSLHLRHFGNVKRVELGYKLLFKFLELPVVAAAFVVFPVIERRQQLLHV